MIADDARDERLNLGLDRVIHSHGDRLAAGGGNQRGGFVDGFGPFAATAAPPRSGRSVNGGTSLAERARDATAGAPGGPATSAI